MAKLKPLTSAQLTSNIVSLWPPVTNDIHMPIQGWRPTPPQAV